MCDEGDTDRVFVSCSWAERQPSFLPHLRKGVRKSMSSSLDFSCSVTIIRKQNGIKLCRNRLEGNLASLHQEGAKSLKCKVRFLLSCLQLRMEHFL